MDTTSKKPLDFNLYAQFEIPQGYMAYEMDFKHIDQNKSDDIEAEYLQKGYKIFHSELIYSHENLYNLKLIVAKTKGYSF